MKKLLFLVAAAIAICSCSQEAIFESDELQAVETTVAQRYRSVTADVIITNNTYEYLLGEFIYQFSFIEDDPNPIRVGAFQVASNELAPGGVRTVNLCTNQRRLMEYADEFGAQINFSTFYVSAVPNQSIMVQFDVYGNNGGSDVYVGTDYNYLSGNGGHIYLQVPFYYGVYDHYNMKIHIDVEDGL